MTANEITRELFSLFRNYEYKLNNTYLYDWESDFSAQSKSGYFVEVEVKVSRSDYFRDFAKPKHKLFKEMISGRGFHIDHFPTQGDLICEYLDGYLYTTYGPDEQDSRGWRSRNWQFDYKTRTYLMNYYGDIQIRHRRVQVYAPATKIKIIPMDKIACPNQLYFAVPKGMLKPDELPPYAGLIELEDNNAMILKRAPYLHKRVQDLSKVLLSKYYNLWKYKVSWDDQIKANEANK